MKSNAILPGLLGLLLMNTLPAMPELTKGDIYEMSAYVVTGTRTARLVTEAPIKTELIVARDMEAYNITTFRDALKLVPSARFESDCQNCGINQIQLLGLSTDYTSILFDGAPLYSGLAKVYGADLFPAIFIDQLEVVKGGSSVLYGPEAMAGVVNMRSSEPFANALKTSLSFESLRGEASEWEASMRGDVVMEDQNLSIKVYGLLQDRESLDLTTDGFTEIPEFENEVFGMQAWWHPLESATLKANYQYLDQAHRGGDRLYLPEEQARVAESLAHKIHMLQASWRHRLGDHFDYTLGTSFMAIERRSFYGSRGDNEQRAYEEAGFSGNVTEAFILDNQNAIDAIARQVWGLTDNDVYYVDSQFNHYMHDHTISFGAQYRFEDLTDGSLYASDVVPTTKDDIDNIGFYLQDQWLLDEKFELVPGIRLDKHSHVDGTIYSPRLAARWQINHETTLRASWSTGFNAPGPFNEDKHIGVTNGGAIFLVNDPSLKEESSQTISTGVDWQPEALDGLFVFHSQVHHTDLRDSFEIDDSGETSGDPNLWYRINGPDARIWVWENNLNWRFGEHFRVDSGLSWIRARLDDPVDRVTGLTSDEFVKRPEWTGQVGLAYENHDLIDLNAFLSYTGPMLAVGEDADIWRRTDPFYILDISASKEFDGFLGADHITVTVGVDNIFDDRQKDLLNNGEERDPTYLYGPVQPRTFFVRVTANW